MAVDNKYLHSEITDKIINLAIKVHKTLGPGFPEKFYGKALVCELSKNKVGYDREKSISVKYENKIIGTQQLDLVVNDAVVVELKVVSEINEAQIAQLVSYLKAAERRVGLILNFAKNTLEIKRVIL